MFWGKSSERFSYKVQILAGTISISLVCSMVLFAFYYRNSYLFYKEKIAANQMNELVLIQERLNNITEQVVQTSNSTVGTLVSGGQFEDYETKTPYEKMVLQKEITNQLTNMIITYDKLQSIYYMSFDGEIFSSNRELDRQAFLEFVSPAPDVNQSGSIRVIPTHEAKYCQYQKSKNRYPYVISYQVYLNRFTPGSTLGLVQIDINYDTLKKAVFAENMTDTDFVVILDRDNKVIFAPDEEMLGKNIADIDSELVSYQDVTAHMDDGKEYVSGSVTVRYAKEEALGWNILQFNSDALFKSSLQNARMTYIAIALVCILCAYVLSYFLSRSINQSILSIVGYMVEASNGNLEIDIKGMEHNEFSQLADRFNDMIAKINILMKENVSKERERTMMEVAALNSKINNHFLYNTLNLIKMLAIKNQQIDIAKIIVSLSNILEYSYRDKDTLVELEREVEFTKNYVYIQTVRFNKNVQVNYEIEPKLEKISVPKMMLQPVIENSILHGFVDDEAENSISITVKRMERDSAAPDGKEWLQIMIRDNGCGFAYKGMEELAGTGLKNVIQRMQIFFDKGFRYQISSAAGCGTVVVFEIWNREAR